MSAFLKSILAAWLATMLLVACDGSSSSNEGQVLADGDNDGVPDIHDNCPAVYNPDQSDAYGRAAEEESKGDVCDDIDDDMVVDAEDNCPLIPNPSQANRDADAYDASNNATGGDVCDTDDDNDGVLDIVDACSLGEGNWTSLPATDHDADGCRDGNEGGVLVEEDFDDDNDGLGDRDDNCPRGDTGWTATPRTDNDGDGCRDAGEDTDDDNDGIDDINPNGSRLDLCPRGDAGWTSTPATDNDGDGCRDAGEDTDDDNDQVPDFCDPTPRNKSGPNDLDHDGFVGDDIDCDGDGLIEISSAAGLHAVRYNLAGTNLTLSVGGAGNATGCGNATAPGNPGDITQCSGYELIADLDLAAAAHNGAYDNWQPIGGCTGSQNCPNAFNATFDGNGHTISNLTINSTAYGSGLFGALSISRPRRGANPNREVLHSSEIRNLHLYNVRVQDAPPHAPLLNINSNYVGGLAGFAADAAIINSSVTNVYLRGGLNVGGLLGVGDNATITSSYAAGVNLLSVAAHAGGLVGSAQYATIASSYAEVENILASSQAIGRQFGGLIGNADFAAVSSSYALNRRIIAPRMEQVGGLLGSAASATVAASYAEAAVINGRDQTGGLLGNALAAKVTSSYAAADVINGRYDVGGLLGYGHTTTVAASYAKAQILSGRDNVGGLLGDADYAEILASHANTLSIRGRRNVGGLVGRAFDNEAGANRDLIARSYAIAASISGEGAVGGLVGNATGADIAYSYAMTGELHSTESPLGGLLGSAANTTEDPNYSLNDSYWWQGVGYTAAQNISAANSGQALSLQEMQQQTSFAGIYANWSNADDGCLGGNDWDLGNSTQLPRLRCLGAVGAGAGPNSGAQHATLAVQLQAQADFLNQHRRRPAMLADPSSCTGLANINISSLGALQDPRNIFDIYFFYKPVSITDWYGRADLLGGVHASQVKLRLPCGERYDFLLIGHAANSAVLNCQLLDEVLIEEQQQAINATFLGGTGPCPATLPYDIEMLSNTPFVSFPPRNPVPIAEGERVELAARLASATEVHWYNLTLTRPARVEILTTGNIDTYGELYRAGIPFPVTRDDNSGEQANFRIFTTLRAATYYLKVSASPTAATALGDYGLVIRREEDACRSIAVDNSDYGPDGQDPLEPYQWYLSKHYVYDAWRKLQGRPDSHAGAGIEIAVVDDGLQLNHEDLAANVIPGASIDLSYNSATELPPSPVSCFDSHGTAVAGIINAVGGNRRGIKGIAYKAKVWAANYISDLGRGAGTDASLRLALGMHRLNTTAVSSNSWGISPVGTQLAPEFPPRPFQQAIDAGITQGFDGKGINYVFAAGNRRTGTNSNLANYEEHLNYIGIMPVCAVGVDDRVSSFSDAGSNLWVCGYSNSGRNAPSSQFTEQLLAMMPAEIIAPRNSEFHHYGLPTIDLSGDAGFNRPVNTRLSASLNRTGDCEYSLSNLFDFGSPSFDIQNFCGGSAAPMLDNPLPWPAGATASYSRYFTGTSAAAPAVSGIIALVRAANRALTWRDVKLILAGSAWMPQHVGVPAGAPAYHNASENYRHHIDYGFGIANASKAVDLALSWTPLPDLLEWDSGREGDDAGLTSANISYQPTAEKNITFVEFVNVEIQGGEQNLQPNFGALSIKLISPQGTESVFTRVHDCLVATFNPPNFSIAPSVDCPAFRNAFVFGSAAHLGEDPQGVWQLQVNSTANSDLNHLQWRLMLHGH